MIHSDMKLHYCRVQCTSLQAITTKINKHVFFIQFMKYKAQLFVSKYMESKQKVIRKINTVDTEA